MKITSQNLAEIAKEVTESRTTYKKILYVCKGTGCVSRAGLTLIDDLNLKLKEKGLEKDFLVVGTGCYGFCAAGPIIVTQPDGIFYQKLRIDDLDRIIDEHLINDKPVESLMYHENGKPIPRFSDIPLFSKQQRVIFRNAGKVDPEDIESYIAFGGYSSLAKVLETMKPGQVIEEVKKAGIRGRGGGGFPTGLKWESCVTIVEQTGNKPYLVCNSDEGDPGVFVDRSIIETDPHAVIEGMLIGAFALGAEEGYIYIRKEYALALKRLQKAIADARERGLLGENIMGKDFKFDIKIHRGAGAFICGESSALMKSLSGKVGEPKDKYIRTVEKGFRDMPTVQNNVETFANIPLIISNGADWFASIGSGDVRNNPWNGSSGTKVFSLVGDVVNTGLFEAPMGITLRELIFEIGGGIPSGRDFKAVQTGGPSGGCLPASKLDEPVDFDSLIQAGSMMSSGGMIIMDDHTCMIDIAKGFIDFLKEESCGKCSPCREGLVILYQLLDAITKGEADDNYLETIESVCNTMSKSSLCDLGRSAPNSVLTTMKYFQDEYIAHIKDKKCPGGICKNFITFTINENCTGCHVCFRNCPVQVISGEPKSLHVIDQSGCIKCGTCYEVCKFDAVTIS